jgi:tetratricopeptide (TPR) repeat protein
VDAVRVDLEKIQSLENALLASKDATSLYWAGQVGIQRREVAAWLSHLDGKDEFAVSLLRSAADIEDLSEKSPMTPGPVVPAREMLADFLLEVKQPTAALAEFESSLKTAPNRLNGLYGAARAAEQAGQAVKAHDYYSKLVEVCQPGDAPESRLAQKYLAVE